MKSQKTTIKDIARELGFSVSTVSRALKNHPDISSETKRLVNELAEKLQYTPNPIALSLKNRRSNVVGVVIPEVVHFFFSSIISGIENVAERNGYSVMLVQSNEQLSREVSAINTILHGKVDGVMASVSKETNNYAHFQKLIDQGIPLVFFDRIAEGIEATHVVVDDFGGAYAATDHLAKQGYKNIAHFAGPQNRQIYRDRLKGYTKALIDNGLEIKEELIIEADNICQAKITVENLVSSGIKFDAIFAVNDFTAAGALLSLKRANLRVPEDVALVGFANESITQMLEPNLSSVHQSAFEMGEKAMESLLQQINSEDRLPPQRIVLPTYLIVRESSQRSK